MSKDVNDCGVEKMSKAEKICFLCEEKPVTDENQILCYDCWSKDVDEIFGNL